MTPKGEGSNAVQTWDFRIHGCTPFLPFFHNTRVNSATTATTITIATIASIDIPCSITMFVDAVCELVTEERVVIGIRLKLLLSTDTTTP